MRMNAHDALDMLAEQIAEKEARGERADHERWQSGQIIRQCVPGDEQRRTALHEAGHALAMELTGSHCKAAHIAGQPRAEWGSGGRNPRSDAIVAVIGSLAEDGTTDHCSPQDRSILDKAISQIRQPGDSTTAVLDDVIREARTIIAEHHDAINELAEHMQGAGRGIAYDFEVRGVVERSLHRKSMRPPMKVTRLASPPRPRPTPTPKPAVAKTQPRPAARPAPIRFRAGARHYPHDGAYSLFECVRDTAASPRAGHPDWKAYGINDVYC